MNSLITGVLILGLVTGNGGVYQKQYNANIQEKMAIVTVDSKEGNNIQFIDNTGGWWLDTDKDHPNFEEGQILKLIIDTKGTPETEDDELLVVESLGFIE